MYGIIKALNDKNLNATDFRILSKIQALCLKNGYCWPSYEFLAQSLGVSRRTAIYSIKRLENLRYIVKGKGTFPTSMKQGANRYFVNNNPDF